MRVLLAFDSGPTGEKALASVAWWIKESGAELHLVHVLSPHAVHETARPQDLRAVTPQSTVTGVPLHVEAAMSGLTEDRSQAYQSWRVRREEEMLNVVKKHLGDYAAVPHVIIADEPALEIVGLAKNISADVIAVGAHGRNRISQVLLGSVAESIVREATVPVLVVGPRAA